MNICLLGATGSVGSSVLEVMQSNPQMKITSISTRSNIAKLQEQRKKFQVKRLIVADENCYEQLAGKAGNGDAELLQGEDGIAKAIESPDTDCVVNALSGTCGLTASFQALQADKKLFLANKESMVAAGPELFKLAAEKGLEIIPLDSEHNAILRCLPQEYKTGEPVENYGVKNLWLTASGGPFLHRSEAEMQEARFADACKHPTWPNMGPKISVDSANMMNKGLEIIEACHLFKIDEEKVKVVIHPQSIFHCLVEYSDGSFVSQLSKPDMKITIHQALNHPKYVPLQQEPLDPLATSKLEFLPPDEKKFPCLNIARQAQAAGGIVPLALIIADDCAIEEFTSDKIAFPDIAKVLAEVTTEFSKQNREFPASIDKIKQMTSEIQETTRRVIAAL